MTSPEEEQAFDPLYEQMVDLWLQPELQRRGGVLSMREVVKAVIEMDPGQPVRVLINDEAEIIGMARATRDLAAGEDVHAEDISGFESLQPLGIGPDSGWVCFIRFGASGLIGFNFTYNRARTLGLLARAREFHDAAAFSAAKGSKGAALDTAFSAAELTVQARMLTMQQTTNKHWARRDWLTGWAAANNAPNHHAETLTLLYRMRNEARYGYAPFDMTDQKLADILATVDEMIQLSLAHIGKAGPDVS